MTLRELSARVALFSDSCTDDDRTREENACDQGADGQDAHATDFDRYLQANILAEAEKQFARLPRG